MKIEITYILIFIDMIEQISTPPCGVQVEMVQNTWLLNRTKNGGDFMFSSTDKVYM